MGKRWTLLLLALAAAAVLIASLVGGPVAAVCFAVAAVAFSPLLMLLGCGRREGGRVALASIVALLVLLEAGLAGMFLLRGQVVDARLFLGLPPAAAIQIYGFLVAPLALVALGYAAGFRAFAPRRSDLERLRALARPEAEGDGGG